MPPRIWSDRFNGKIFEEKTVWGSKNVLVGSGNAVVG